MEMIDTAFKKRQCPVKFDLSFGGFDGTQYCTVTVYDDVYRFWISDAMGDLFGSMLDIIYALNIEFNDPKTDHTIEYILDDPENTSRITELKADTLWDSEGTDMRWTFSRKLDNNDKQIVDVEMNFDFNEIKKYKIELPDLNYAVSRAVTDILKKSGFCGYHFSTNFDYINIVNFLMLKNLSLTGRALNFSYYDDGCRSSVLKDEIDLLLFDM